MAAATAGGALLMTTPASAASVITTTAAARVDPSADFVDLCDGVVRVQLVNGSGAQLATFAVYYGDNTSKLYKVDAYQNYTFTTTANVGRIADVSNAGGQWIHTWGDGPIGNAPFCPSVTFTDNCEDTQVFLKNGSWATVVFN